MSDARGAEGNKATGVCVRRAAGRRAVWARRVVAGQAAGSGQWGEEAGVSMCRAGPVRGGVGAPGHATRAGACGRAGKRTCAQGGACEGRVVDQVLVGVHEQHVGARAPVAQQGHVFIEPLPVAVAGGAQGGGRG